jgi:hypothetical protein
VRKRIFSVVCQESIICLRLIRKYWYDFLKQKKRISSCRLIDNDDERIFSLDKYTLGWWGSNQMVNWWLEPIKMMKESKCLWICSGGQSAIMWMWFMRITMRQTNKITKREMSKDVYSYFHSMSLLFSLSLSFTYILKKIKQVNTTIWLVIYDN